MKGKPMGLKAENFFGGAENAGRKGRLARVAVLAAFCAFFFLALFSVHEVGAPVATAMDDYFIENGQAETGSNNIVTAVVFDYRGLDTLGEASVLFAAATGVFIATGGLKR
jgi:multisubunit Na+/H+ antiporter MnhB subunit